MSNFTEVISFVEVNENLTAETIQVLAENEQLASFEADTVASMKPFTLALELAKALPEVPKPQLAKMAAHIVVSFKELGFGNVETPPAVPQQTVMPDTIKLEVPKNTSEMSTAELLEILSKEPQRFKEIEGILQTKPDYRDALRKAGEKIGFVREGKFSVADVLGYIQYLASDEWAQPQPKFNTLRPVGLRVALGVEVRRMKDPFTGRTYVGLLDGYDLSTAGEIYLAIVWFVETQPTGSTMRSLNALQRRAYLEAMVSGNLPVELRAVLEDYNAAKADNDPSTRNISIFVEEGEERGKKSGEISGIVVTDRMLDASIRGIQKADPEFAKVMLQLPREDLRLFTAETMKVQLSGGNLDEAALDTILENLPQDVQQRFLAVIGVADSKQTKTLSEADYRRMVKEYANANIRPLNVSVNNNKTVSGIINGGRVGTNGNVCFQNAILISDFNAGTNSDISGFVRVPIDVSISTGANCNDSVRVETIKWSDIAKELGIF